MLQKYLLENKFRFFRAKVVDNKDPERLGRVKVWIPDLMYDLDVTNGIWILPANQIYGGSIESGDGYKHSGQSIIPNIGDYIWIFFENDDLTHGFYVSKLSLQDNAKVPESQVGNEYEKHYVLFRSPEGRSIWISDDNSTPDAGIYLTGKKRQYNVNNPLASVYSIYQNQSVIGIFERDKDRILLADYYKNYFSINTTDSTITLYGSSLNGNNKISLFNDKTGLLLEDDNNQGKVVIQNKQCIITIENGNIHIDANENMSLSLNNAEIHISNNNIKIQTSGSIIELSDGNVTIYASSKIVLQAPLIEENPGVSKSPSPDTVKSPITFSHDDIPW